MDFDFPCPMGKAGASLPRSLVKSDDEFRTPNISTTTIRQKQDRLQQLVDAFPQSYGPFMNTSIAI